MAVAQKDLGATDGGAQRVARSPGVEKDVIFVVDAGNAYADADLVSDLIEVTGVADANGGAVVLDSLTLYDKSDQKAALSLVFASASTSLGTINSAPNISDANAITSELQVVGVAAADWIDCGGIAVATLRNVNLPLRAGAATTSVWVGVISEGTPTYAGAGDLVGKFHFS